MAYLGSVFANLVCTRLAVSGSSWMALFVTLGWLSPGVAGVTVSHSAGQTGPCHGVRFQEQREHALPRPLLHFMFVDVLLVGVGHVASPIPGGGEK